MEAHFTWKTRVFRNLYEIYENENLAGELKNTGWKRTSAGKLKEKELLFEVKGFFKKEFLIKNPEDDSVTGQIIFNTWRTKATIIFGNQEYKWQFDNFFRTKWSVSDGNGTLLKYQSYFKSGEITSYIKDELLILAGLYIRDYLSQRAASAATSV